MKKVFIFPIILIGILSCKSVAGLSNDTSKMGDLTSDSLYRFSISFFSKGSGTDRIARGEFEIYLENYNKKKNKKLHYETTNWGREGEVNYCFKLTELKKKEQEKFIAECKNLLKNSDLVRFEEFTPCKSNKIGR